MVMCPNCKGDVNEPQEKNPSGSMTYTCPECGYQWWSY
jgi:hypothetical protein